MPILLPPGPLAMSAGLVRQVAIPDDLSVRVAVSRRFDELLRQSEGAWKRGWRTDAEGRSGRLV